MKVTKEIQRQLNLKNKGMISGAKAMRGIFEDLRRQAMAEMQGVSSDSYTAYYMRQNRAMLEKAIADTESAAKRELDSRLSGMWNDGGDLVTKALSAGGISVSGQYHMLGQTLLDTLKDFASTRLEGLTEAAWNKINGEISLGALGQKTPYEVAKSIAGTLKDPGIFRNVFTRAETITETEMGRVFSTATLENMKQAVKSVTGLKKEWWHAGHPKKPRYTHLLLHGQRQDVNVPFVIGSLSIDYPRDPKAALEEVIHCGCEVVPWKEEWAQGKEMKIAA